MGCQNLYGVWVLGVGKLYPPPHSLYYHTPLPLNVANNRQQATSKQAITSPFRFGHSSFGYFRLYSTKAIQTSVPVPTRLWQAASSSLNRWVPKWVNGATRGMPKQMVLAHFELVAHFGTAKIPKWLEDNSNVESSQSLAMGDPEDPFRAQPVWGSSLLLVEAKWAAPVHGSRLPFQQFRGGANHKKCRDCRWTWCRGNHILSNVLAQDTAHSWFGVVCRPNCATYVPFWGILGVFLGHTMDL